MKFTDEQKKQIVRGFIKIFTRISNKEYQKRVWIEGKGSERDDFDDTVNDFFCECDSILEKHKKFGITENQYALLVKFREAFKAFSDENDYPGEFIESPEWKKIMEMAKKVLKVFNYTDRGKTL